jgi:hypothetical protein
MQMQMVNGWVAGGWWLLGLGRVALGSHLPYQYQYQYQQSAISNQQPASSKQQV